jgi:hypothetical protein
LARNLSDVGDRLKERLLAVKGALIKEVATRVESMSASHEGFEPSAIDKTVALCRALANLERFFSEDSGLKLSMQADAFTIATTLGLQAAVEFSVGNRTGATRTLQTALELPGVKPGGIDFTEADKALQARLLESLVAEACVITNRYGDAITLVRAMLPKLAGVDADVDELCNWRLIAARAHMGLGNFTEAEVSLQWVIDHLSQESPVATSPFLWAYTELRVKGVGLSSGAETYYDHCFVEFQLEQLLLLLGKHRTTPLSWRAPASTCPPLAAPGTQAGTPPRAPPPAAAATTPPASEAAARAAVIAADAERLPPDWFPPTHPTKRTAYGSTPQAPYTKTKTPKQLLELGEDRLEKMIMCACKTRNGGIASKFHLIYVVMPFDDPKISTSCVLVAAELTCDEVGLDASSYVEVVKVCISNLDTQTVISFGSLVTELTPEHGEAKFQAWSAQLATFSLDIAKRLCKADPTTSLFGAKYQNWQVQLGPTANGFSQVEVYGFEKGASAGTSAMLMATLMVVIPQKAGKKPCRRAVACLEQALALAARRGTWVFVVVIDVGKLKNKSIERSFDTPAAN